VPPDTARAGIRRTRLLTPLRLSRGGPRRCRGRLLLCCRAQRDLSQLRPIQLPLVV